MRVGTYPTRNFATLGPLWLQPPFAEAYPKPSLRTKLIKEKFSNKRILLMSGTPAVESYSQWLHQFWISVFTPFSQYKNFYRWADIFVNKKEKKIGTHSIIDYSDARTELIDNIIKPSIS